MPTWVVSAFLENDLLALNRAIGIIRRRNISVPSISLGPSGRAGLTRLICIVESDAAATERMANQLRKMVGVSEVVVSPESACTGREHALVRVRISPSQLSALLDIVALYNAEIVEESPDDLLIEATGTAPFMVTLLRALEPFGIVDLARSGTLAVPPAEAPAPDAGAGRPSAAPPRAVTAVPV